MGVIYIYIYVYKICYYAVAARFEDLSCVYRRCVGGVRWAVAGVVPQGVLAGGIAWHVAGYTPGGGWWVVGGEVGGVVGCLAEVLVEGVTRVSWVYRRGGVGVIAGVTAVNSRWWIILCTLAHLAVVPHSERHTVSRAADWPHILVGKSIPAQENTLEAKTRLEREARLPDRPPPCPGR